MGFATNLYTAGGSLALSSANISKVEFTDALCGCNELMLSNACAKELVIKTPAVSSSTVQSIEKGSKYRFEFSSNNVPVIEEYFYCTKIEKRSTQTQTVYTITFVDVMSMLTMDYIYSGTEATTQNPAEWVDDIIDYVSDEAGITVQRDATWVYPSVQISSSDFPSEMTVREFVGYIAGRIGCNAVISAGKISAQKYNQSTYNCDSSQVYADSESIDDSHTINNLRIQTSEGYINSANSYTEDSTVCIINPFIKDLSTLQDVATKSGLTSNVTYCPGTIKVNTGDRLQAGSKIQYTNTVRGVTTYLICCKSTFTYDGGICWYVESYEPSTQQSTFDTEVGGGGAGGTEPGGGGGGGGTFSGSADDVTYDPDETHTEGSVAEELSNLKSAEYIDYDRTIDPHEEDSVAEALALIEAELFEVDQLLGSGLI